DFKPSWNIATGFERSKYDPNNNLRAYALLSSGVSLNIFDNFLFMINMDARPRHDDARKEKFRLPLGFSLINQVSFSKLRLGHQSYWYREVVTKTNEYSIAPYIRY